MKQLALEEARPVGPPLLPTAHLLDRTHANDPTAVYLARLAPGSRRHIAADRLFAHAAGTLAVRLPLGATSVRAHKRAPRASRGALCPFQCQSSPRRAPRRLEGDLAAWAHVCRGVRARSRCHFRLRHDLTGRSRARRRRAANAVRRVHSGDAGAWCAGRALFALLYGAGLRRAEATNLELADVDRETGEVKVLHGKRRKQRLVYLSSGGRDALEGWLRFRGDAPGPLLRAVGKGGAVRDRRLPADSVYRIVKAAAKRSAVKEFSPHDLRRTFVSGLLDAGADISVVKEMAGHASISTTVRYDRRGERAQKKASELLHVPYAGSGVVAAAGPRESRSSR